ncbi:MAG TPA: 2-oxoglutarate dehydrogenase, E2 component, dihydrolipoamide succinyltransferase [Bryobacterales bacterium]|nr:2-oxoglutarate dehydrogenase, E2 component, dihydrolipoamide succinyltransferase [Bryobacterales bacterium]
MSDVLMPQMGESIVEGTITKWMKQVGDPIERDEPLFEISTDKVDSEVPAPVAGVLEKIFVQEGETVEINTLVARIGDGSGSGDDEPAAEPAAEAAPEPAAAPKPAAKESCAPAAAAAAAKAPEQATQPAVNGKAAESGERVRSSPLVRRLAKEQNIDLSRVPGTGQGGRVSKKDIEAYLKGGAAPEAAPAPSEASAPASAPAAGESFGTFRPAPATRFGNHRVEPLPVLRKKIAEHMALSMRLAPHVSTIHQIDCTAIAKLRAAAKEKFLEQNGTKLTFMPFFLRASAAALKEFPEINAALDGDQVVFHKDVNIGMAVAIEGGLIVPVIRAVDEKSILGLQKSVNDLAGRARDKKLKPDEVTQGTFSISNYGSYGSLFATPAINQPQSAILGLGAIQKTPVVVHDAIGIRSICYATLTFDHRIIDGAMADQFMTHLKGVIENWSEAVL